MSKFLEKYNIIENAKVASRKVNNLTPEEKNRLKMIQSIDDQLNFLDKISSGQDVSSSGDEKIQKPRLFWQDTLGGFLFTPRFGNDFLFGKDRGVSCSSYDELRALIQDFKTAVSNCEFDERITEIASARKGRGAGVSRNRV